MSVRLAQPADAPRLAALHQSRIVEGFLSTLGPTFLTRLYRRITLSAAAFAHVEERDGTIVGFCATTTSVGRLYREFLLRDGVVVGVRAFPTLVRSAPRVVETLRYPAGEGDDLPAAEILSVAVEAASAGQGIGRHVVDAAVAELERRGVGSAKVVAGADNGAALALYRAAGFRSHSRIAVHAGVRSEVLVWTGPDEVSG